MSNLSRSLNVCYFQPVHSFKYFYLGSTSCFAGFWCLKHKFRHIHIFQRVPVYWKTWTYKQALPCSVMAAVPGREECCCHLSIPQVKQCIHGYFKYLIKCVFLKYRKLSLLLNIMQTQKTTETASSILMTHKFKHPLLTAILVVTDVFFDFQSRGRKENTLQRASLTTL